MSHTLSRRAFVAAAAALPFTWRAHAQPAGRAARWVLLGTDTGAGIYRCAWDPDTGRLGEPALAIRADAPTFMAMHPSLPRLYAVHSVNGAAAGVSCYDVNRATGALRLINRQPARGDGPCFVAVDATGRSAFVANYTGASLVGYSLTGDGSLLQPTGTLLCKGASACGHAGPVRERQDGSHLHSATISPGNDFLLSCDLGNDAIEVVAIHPEADSPLGAALRVAARPGSGPRHVAWHPNGRWVYVVHELDCTIERFDWSVTAGRASLVRQNGTAVSTLAAGLAVGANTGCEIVMGPGGTCLYTCTRGSDTLEMHRVRSDGALQFQQRIACGGLTPRHFAFDPTGRFLLCANQDAPGTVTVFARDATSGELRGPLQSVAAESPMFVQFV